MESDIRSSETVRGYMFVHNVERSYWAEGRQCSWEIRKDSECQSESSGEKHFGWGGKEKKKRQRQAGSLHRWEKIYRHFHHWEVYIQDATPGSRQRQTVPTINLDIQGQSHEMNWCVPITLMEGRPPSAQLVEQFRSTLSQCKYIKSRESWKPLVEVTNEFQELRRFRYHWRKWCKWWLPLIIGRVRRRGDGDICSNTFIICKGWPGWG